MLKNVKYYSHHEIQSHGPPKKSRIPPAITNHSYL